MKGTWKRGRPHKRQRDEAENDLNITGIKNRQDMVSDHQGMENDCIRRQGPPQTVVLTENKPKLS